MDKIEKFKESIEPNKSKLSSKGGVPNSEIKDSDSDSFAINLLSDGCAEVDTIFITNQRKFVRYD